MRYEVLLTDGAERDLEAIYDYIAGHDASAKADYVLDRLMEIAAGLATLPERGAHCPELQALGMRDVCQVLFKPYRIVYRVVGRRVFIAVIADGRRDLQALLARRLLSA
ncbi:MAG TPA: type II toxin-antitoxin system RelE/ParE family toxin [Polyangia bacterium]|jgi:toxin ParE1/3/4